jgi:hypothetical protein
MVRGAASSSGGALSPEPGGGEGVEVGIALAIDVEVPQGDEVVVEVLASSRPVAQPLRDRSQLSEAVLGRLPVNDVQGDEDERLATRLEGDRVGRAGELLA